MRPARRSFVIIGGLATIAAGLFAWRFGVPFLHKAPGRQTVDDVLSTYKPDVDARLAPRFVTAAIGYPPSEIALVATKLERNLEVWARGPDSPFRRIVSYLIQGASGRAGPKLREGDLQVPEGVYRVVSLNPNSRFHLSFELDYPNDFDRAQAARDGRTQLGGEIFVHGGSSSIGCLAMGDEAIRELFVLVARVGRDRVRVVIAPQEPADNGFPDPEANSVSWAPELHRQILEALRVIRGAGDG